VFARRSANRLHAVSGGPRGEQLRTEIAPPAAMSELESSNRVESNRAGSTASSSASLPPSSFRNRKLKLSRGPWWKNGAPVPAGLFSAPRLNLPAGSTGPSCRRAAKAGHSNEQGQAEQTQPNDRGRQQGWRRMKGHSRESGFHSHSETHRGFAQFCAWSWCTLKLCPLTRTIGSFRRRRPAAAGGRGPPRGGHGNPPTWWAAGLLQVWLAASNVPLMPDRLAWPGGACPSTLKNVWAPLLDRWPLHGQTGVGAGCWCCSSPW